MYSKQRVKCCANSQLKKTSGQSHWSVTCFFSTSQTGPYGSWLGVYLWAKGLYNASSLAVNSSRVLTWFLTDYPNRVFYGCLWHSEWPVVCRCPLTFHSTFLSPCFAHGYPNPTVDSLSSTHQVKPSGYYLSPNCCCHLWSQQPFVTLTVMPVITLLLVMTTTILRDIFKRIMGFSP